jgi:hypothetical protein
MVSGERLVFKISPPKPNLPINPGPRYFIKLRYGWEECNELVDAFLNLFWVLLIIGRSEPFEIFTLANCSCPTSPSGPCLSVPRCPTNLYSPKIFEPRCE